MTNKEIQEKRNEEIALIYSLPLEAVKTENSLEIDKFMDLARKDERERVIKEIEEWVFNSVPSANALSTSITISGRSTKTVTEILTKLNQLKK